MLCKFYLTNGFLFLTRLNFILGNKRESFYPLKYLVGFSLNNDIPGSNYPDYVNCPDCVNYPDYDYPYFILERPNLLFLDFLKVLLRESEWSKGSSIFANGWIVHICVLRNKFFLYYGWTLFLLSKYSSSAFSYFINQKN